VSFFPVLIPDPDDRHLRPCSVRFQLDMMFVCSCLRFLNLLLSLPR
jgi:hypothetical protein